MKLTSGRGATWVLAIALGLTGASCGALGTGRPPGAARALPKGRQTESIESPGKADGAAIAGARVAFARLPLAFEENRGQTDPRVKFVSRRGGLTVFLAPNEAVLTLRKGAPGAFRRRDPAWNQGETAAATDTGTQVVVRIKLVGAKPGTQVVGLGELPGKSNYFIGSDPEQWRTNVPTYAKVKYEDVYPGVDLIYYGNQRQLEYDFVVSPSADPETITLGFEGAQKVRLDERGDLVLETQTGDIRLQSPVIYQEGKGSKQAIAGGFVLKGEDEAGFKVAAYDPTRPLIIDPVLSYSTYLGGALNDYVNGVAVDASGNTYVTGETFSTNFPTASPFQGANAGTSNAFVTKINAAGSALVYSTYLGGGGIDSGESIAVDGSGNAYVTGNTGSTNFPTANPLQASSAGLRDVFVTKLNASGAALVYSSYLGGSGVDYGDGIALDASRNAYLTGSTNSTNFPTGVPPLYGTLAGGRDAFATKLNAAGSALVYSTYLGGGGDDWGHGIALDSSGNAYVTGDTASANFPIVASLQGSLAGGQDVFVTKLNSAGSALVYSTYLGGGGNDWGRGIAVDGSGGAYVTGETASTNFPTASPLQSFNAGINDVFVAKLAGHPPTLGYSTYLGGDDIDSGRAIAVDTSGNAYITGTTASTNFRIASPLQAANGGGFDAFAAKVNPTGSALTYSTYLGGADTDVALAVAVDGSGTAHLAGWTFSTNFPTVGAYQSSSGGGVTDGFMAKITDLTFRGWGPLPVGGSTTSGPALAVHNGEPNLVVRGVDNGVYLCRLTGGVWTGWTTPGGLTDTEPAAVSYGGGLWVFVRGLDGGVYANRMSSQIWSGWSQVGGSTPSGPAATVLSNEIFVFVRGGDNGIYLNRYNGTAWSGWGAIGGATPSSLAATVFNNELQLYAQGGDNGIYRNRFNGTTWSGWSAVGGSTVSGPGAVAFGAALYLFVRGTDSGVYYNQLATSWSGWKAMGGQTPSKPGAAATASTLYLAVRGADNGVYLNQMP